MLATEMMNSEKTPSGKIIVLAQAQKCFFNDEKNNLDIADIDLAFTSMVMACMAIYAFKAFKYFYTR